MAGGYEVTHIYFSVISRMHMNLINLYHSTCQSWKFCAIFECIHAPSESFAVYNSVKCLLSSAYLDFLSLNYFSSVGSLQRLGIVQLIPTMFQKFIYCRNHKPKEIISGYVGSGTPLGFNRHKNCFNQRQKRRWFPPFSMRKGVL